MGRIATLLIALLLAAAGALALLGVMVPPYKSLAHAPADFRHGKWAG